MYCKIFINYNGSKHELFQLVKSVFPVLKTELNTLVTSWGEVYIAHNDEYDPKRAEETDGFLYYPYLLDMEITTPDYIALTNRLLQALYDAHAQAVPACDYEDFLIKNK